MPGLAPNPCPQRKMPMHDTPAPLPALTLLAAAALLPAAPVSGQTDGGEGTAAPEPDAAQAYDECASPEVVFEEGSGPLTRAERIARMEQALHESLSRFERCQAASSGSGGGAAGGQGGGSVAAGGNGRTGESVESGESGESAAGADSVAARSVSGTQSPSEADVSGAGAPEAESGESASASGSVASRSVSGTETAPETDAQPVSVTYAPDAADASPRPAPGALDNGKVPDDIPAADNDSVLEAQIRRAAMAETDPEIRAKLWNEYRAYKGLPQVPADR